MVLSTGVVSTCDRAGHEAALHGGDRKTVGQCGDCPDTLPVAGRHSGLEAAGAVPARRSDAYDANSDHERTSRRS